MTILTGGEEGSALPPSRRDINDTPALTRAHDRNLARIATGFGSGRIPNASMVQSGLWAEDALTDTGESADDTMIVWEWNDRHTVTVVGAQTARLTYEPLDESLVVLWHPNGGGGVPITQEHFVLNGQTVTIPDPGILAVGDQFSFQYPHNPGEEPGFIPAELLDVGCADWTTTTLPLPPATQPASLMVLASTSLGSPAVFSDPRFTQVYSYAYAGFLYREVWIGYADTALSPINITVVTSGGHTVGFAPLAVYSPGSSVGPPTVHLGPGFDGGEYPYIFQSINARQAIGVIFPSYSVVPGPLFPDASGAWEDDILCGYGHAVGIYHWTSASGEIEASPLGQIEYGGYPNPDSALTFPLYGPGEI